jgi:hypothetical protein
MQRPFSAIRRQVLAAYCVPLGACVLGVSRWKIRGWIGGERRDVPPRRAGHPVSGADEGNDAASSVRAPSDTADAGASHRRRPPRLRGVDTPDVQVPIPGHGDGKIGSAYSDGGSALTIQMVEQLTNVRSIISR